MTTLQLTFVIVCSLQLLHDSFFTTTFNICCTTVSSQLHSIYVTWKLKVTFFCLFFNFFICALFLLCMSLAWLNDKRGGGRAMLYLQNSLSPLSFFLSPLPPPYIFFCSFTSTLFITTLSMLKFKVNARPIIHSKTSIH